MKWKWSANVHVARLCARCIHMPVWLLSVILLATSLHLNSNIANSVMRKRFCKIAKSDYYFRYVSVCLSLYSSVRLYACNNSASSVQSFMQSNIWAFFENLSRIFKFHWNPKRITVTLHEDLFTCMTVSLWALLRMRNVSDKYFRENQNTHFIFNYFCPWIVPFMRYSGKIRWSQRGHKWQYNTAHALCTLDN